MAVPWVDMSDEVGVKAFKFDEGGYTGMAEKMDRRLDPYMSSLITPDNKIVGTGLHSTMGKAKQFAEKTYRQMVANDRAVR